MGVVASEKRRVGRGQAGNEISPSKDCLATRQLSLSFLQFALLCVPSQTGSYALEKVCQMAVVVLQKRQGNDQRLSHGETWYEDNAPGA